MPALRGLFGSKTLRRSIGGALVAGFGYLCTYVTGLAPRAELEAAETRLAAGIKTVAENSDPAKVDARVKVTEAQASQAAASAQACMREQQETAAVIADLYQRLVSLQAADAEPDRRLKAQTSAAARKEFKMLLGGGTTAGAAQRAADIVLESPIPGDRPARRPR